MNAVVVILRIDNYFCYQTGKQLESTHTMLNCGACTALGEIGRCGPLPLVNESREKKVTTKLSIIDNLLEKVQSNKVHGKVRKFMKLRQKYQ